MTAPHLGAYALAYARRGATVLPLHTVTAGRCSCGNPNCSPKHAGKHPRTNHGLLDASADPVQVSRWWEQWPDANIGLVPASVGAVVVDVDGPAGEAAAQAAGLLSEPTCEVETGREDGGRHRWYRHPGGTIGNADLAPHLEVRADAGYVVAPPSLHRTGRRYAWRGRWADLAELPLAVLARLRNGAPVSNARTPPDQLPAWMLPYLDVAEGGRNSTLTRFVGHAFRKGHAEAEAFAMALGVNAHYRPPLEKDEVLAIVRSIGTKEARKAPASPEATAGRHLKTTEAINVTEKAIEWTWRHRLLRGAVNLLEGEPEAGKSSIMYDLLARLSRGDDLPDGAPCEPHRVLIVGAEDALECVVLPRLKAADAHLGNIRFVTGAFDPDAKHPQRIVLPDDLPLLAIAVADRDILFVDSSINDLAERTIRPGDDIRMRELLGALGDLAQQLNVTVIATRHARKGGSRNPLEYGSGTMGVAAKARVILAVLRDPKDRSVRLFARSKCNVAPKVATLRCVFVPSDSLVPDSAIVVTWHGEDPRDTHEILADIAASYAGRKDDSSKARRALAEWLRDGEWKAVKTLRALCVEAKELSWKAIEKARAEMAIDSERRPGVGWCWRDPYAGTRNDDTQRE